MIKTPLLIMISILFLCTCSACANEKLLQSGSETKFEIAAEAVYCKITAANAYDIMATMENYILLDVRTVEEYKEQRIEGAILLPDYEIADSTEAELADKEALIPVYCRSGRRRANAAKELVGMGYTNVYDFGGIIDWPYETISG